MSHASWDHFPPSGGEVTGKYDPETWDNTEPRKTKIGQLCVSAVPTCQTISLCSKFIILILRGQTQAGSMSYDGQSFEVDPNGLGHGGSGE